MLHEAETDQDVEVYMSTMKLLVNVFSMSHQTHYVDLCKDVVMSVGCCKMYENSSSSGKQKEEALVYSRNLLWDGAPRHVPTKPRNVRTVAQPG
jgi:hypothetical protein